MKTINWREIIIFYFIAVTVSAPFRLGLIHPESLFSLPYGLNSLYAVFRGIGPAIGFIVIVYLLNSKLERPISFFGKKKWASIMAIITIPLGLGVTGVTNTSGLNTHYYGLLYGTVLILYALGEEYGWRGYLQQALAPMKMIQKVLVITILWYVWHLNFLNPEISLQTHGIHFLSILMGTWGLLKITEITESILFASAVHLSFNLFADVNGEFNYRLIILIISILVWIVLLKVYYRVQHEKNLKSES
jgi:uncharacterized protein